MRLWHYELISVLPQKQLMGQWRELSAIIGLINKFNSPNSLIVNKIMDYPISHYRKYIQLVEKEIRKRGYCPQKSILEKLETINKSFFNEKENYYSCKYNKIFEFWHNDRYFFQCYFNLQEKYDCGGILEDEWAKIKCLAIKKLQNMEFNFQELI